MSQYAYLSDPDSEWMQFAGNIPAPEIPKRFEDILMIRKAFSQRSLDLRKLWEPPFPKSGLKTSDITVSVEGGSILVRTYVPEARADESHFPLLVWYHGGGFILGDLESDDPLMRLICVNQRVSCVNVDYRLAPEHPFPIPVYDSYQATKWAAENAASLSADLTKGFLVGGSSAGANIAAVLTIKARDDPLFKWQLTGQILQVPMVCPPSAYPTKWKGELLSFEQNKDAPAFNSKTLERAIETYAPPDPSAPDIAPLLASSHANLPAAYIQVCGLDPLRDEGLLYAKVLDESGVSTQIDVYPGLPHGFHHAVPQLEKSKKLIQDLHEGVVWLLQGH